MQNPNHPHVLIVGCGDIGTRVGESLIAQNWRVSAMRRSAEKLPQVFHHRLSADIYQLQLSDISAVLEQGLDAIIYSVTPSERSEAGYRRAYLEGVERLQSVLSGAPAVQRPKFWLHFSSSRVWGQSVGEWVSEDTSTEPADVYGEYLLAGEKIAQSSMVDGSILRFSGIYGKTRAALQSRVDRWLDASSAIVDAQWTNRIHADDAAGFVTYLLMQKQAGKTIAPLYVVSDDRPTQQREMQQWVRERFASSVDNFPVQDIAKSNQMKSLGKRLSNQRMKQSGYVLQYPDYRAGYAALLDAG